ncbi:MAG: SDR family NAD(P)-dependent oxidoreductase [Nitriliruptorales bacterium]|nr:SDR family NAD(P)-dependent oxidoreductase [Nitriliruptorales bacterium]
MTKTILITGCSSGIGRALANEFVSRGHLVYATARKTSDLDALERAGFRPLTLDVRDHEQIDAALRTIAEEVGHLDVLVNNAGINAVGAVLDVPAEKLREQLEINVIGPIELVRRAFPLMRDRDARIVNIGSVVGVHATPFAGPYSASKAALHRLNDALRMELAPFGIHVLLVQPGAIRSAMGDNASANATVDGLGPYAKIADRVEARARLSQEGKPTPAEEFAVPVVAAALADKPPALVREGANSWILPTLERWVPTSISDRVLSRKFGLHRL